MIPSCFLVFVLFSIVLHFHERFLNNFFLVGERVFLLYLFVFPYTYFLLMILTHKNISILDLVINKLSSFILSAISPSTTVALYSFSCLRYENIYLIVPHNIYICDNNYLRVFVMIFPNSDFVEYLFLFC